MPEEQFLVAASARAAAISQPAAAQRLSSPMAQHGMVGDMKQPVDLTYLADTVIMLRYFEALGRVRRAMSVIKKRTGSARRYHPRIPDRLHRHDIGGPLREFQGVLRGVPVYVGATGAVDAGVRSERTPTRIRERTLILAPRGRDAVVAKGILRDARLHAEICVDLPELLREIGRGADVAIMTEEASARIDARALADWVATQPPWSDFPFVVLTEHGGGLERNPAAARADARSLGNVTLLERPFHPTTLVSVVRTGLARPAAAIRMAPAQRRARIARQRAHRGTGRGQPSTAARRSTNASAWSPRCARCSGSKRSANSPQASRTISTTC